MKIIGCFLMISVVALTFGACKCARQQGQGAQTGIERYDRDIDDLRIRDPFVLADTADSTYYMHVNNGNQSIICYKSKDLKMWHLCGEPFTPDTLFWGKNNFWAPDIYHYKGKYYLFVTFIAPGKNRGTSILVSDYPDRDFKPLANRPITPQQWTCIDGSLYVDKDGAPWLLFCHEWIEVGDGEIYIQRLTEDLTGTIGKPVLLFRGSSAPWAGLITSGMRTGTVTNSPFIYPAGNGKLLLFWSSFRQNGEYAIGKAVSRSGNPAGPWIQSREPLKDDGGHAMLFRDMKGSLLMSYHTNDLPERVVLRPVRIEDEEVIFLN